MIRTYKTICNTCKIEFPADRLGRKFCSHTCVSIARNKGEYSERNCIACNKLYIPTNKNSKWCSSQCYGTSLKSIPLKTCLECDKEFQPTANHLNFCSIACASMNKKTNPFYKRGGVLIEKANKVCPCCNKKFYSKDRRAYTTECCSNLCAGRLRKQPEKIVNCKLCGAKMLAYSGLHHDFCCKDHLWYYQFLMGGKTKAIIYLNLPEEMLLLIKQYRQIKGEINEYRNSQQRSEVESVAGIIN